jgi:hypothetical protein
LKGLLAVRGLLLYVPAVDSLCQEVIVLCHFELNLRNPFSHLLQKTAAEIYDIT